MAGKPSSENRKIQQVKMLPQMHAQIKQTALHHDIEVSEMYDRVIRHYLDLVDLGDTEVEYLSSPRNGINTSIWIDRDIHQRVQKRSKLDGISMNRVIYTAVKNYTNSLT